jgi:hypothetical protein
MVLPLVRPATSHSRRLLTPSTRTSVTSPIAAWCNPSCTSRCSCCKATIRRVFSGSVTSSTIRFPARVLGRAEYLNENIL